MARESFETETKSPEETMALAACVARFLRPGDLVTLKGGLGTGKTTFVKGLVKELYGTGGDEVTSPTFVLMHEYQSGQKLIYHIDGYRLKDAEGARAAGLEEFLYSEAMKVIEWPERLGTLVPDPAVRVEFSVSGDDRRWVSFTGDRDLIAKLKRELALK
ncbi:MAG: tRNA (adenosine(37)-N6)-threonylcarbamoyltransferase complex ATPase subunit type 1 TsaE [Candidatus Omnitrophica bacterium]|nr:tRNA (adenosine(37)-N6)-threonylcarbamoyltransferase complex ATPase subunit type 1 TsaE [Candidatus Omnitrophota bacterium]